MKSEVREECDGERGRGREAVFSDFSRSSPRERNTESLSSSLPNADIMIIGFGLEFPARISPPRTKSSVVFDLVDSAPPPYLMTLRFSLEYLFANPEFA